MAWTDVTASDTTNRNTSRFILLSKSAYTRNYVNLQPSIRSTDAGGNGAAFYLTTNDPIALLGSGESTI